MFNPSQADVRRFFCSVYGKWLVKASMEPLETIAALWIAEHPEYHGDLSDAESALGKTYDGENGQSNPFLHLSMHLSISEQCSIDQPAGVRQAIERLTQRLDSLHDAHHIAMEELGQMLWDSQRTGSTPDAAVYEERLRSKALQ